MPEGLPRKPGWLIRHMRIGEKLTINHPDRPRVVLTLCAPKTAAFGHCMALRDEQGVHVFVPMGAKIEPVPGVVIVPRRHNRMAIRSENIEWTRFEPKRMEEAEPVTF